jgi:AmmeMemoRadiSam system protein B
MAAPLPRLRPDLDLMPSPLAEQPGLLIRDPMRYSTVTLVVPPGLVPGLACFDGQQDEGDLRAALSRATGRVSTGDNARHMVDALSQAGFLDDGRFAELRATRAAALAALAERPPAHAGSAYPDDVPALTETLRGYFDGATSEAGARPGAPPFAIAAPHVSPEGGWRSYAAAYRTLPADAGERVFVVLGTSHYGVPDRYGLTRKPFATPFGNARTETTLVDALAKAAPSAVSFDEPAGFVEHAVEFQVVFLQHLYGPDVRILPVLCGAFVDGPRQRQRPEASDAVERFVGALGELAARHGERLSFVLGVDFAHVGLRYGDRRAARADIGPSVEVARRDRERLARIAAGDGDGFWELVTERGDDDLKWCGTSPLYTFLRALPEARGTLHGYEQWNIDEASIVSFGAVSFSRK